MVPEQTQDKHGFDRVIRAVINYVRAVPSIDDYETLGQDIFGSEQDSRIRHLKDAVQYFHKGTKDGYSKQKPKPSKKGKNIPFENEKKEEKSIDTKQG